MFFKIRSSVFFVVQHQKHHLTTRLGQSRPPIRLQGFPQRRMRTAHIVRSDYPVITQNGPNCSINFINSIVGQVLPKYFLGLNQDHQRHVPRMGIGPILYQSQANV